MRNCADAASMTSVCCAQWRLCRGMGSFRGNCSARHIKIRRFRSVKGRPSLSHTLWRICLQALRLSPEDRVLEVGTGTGYEAAVMSRIVREVYTIERFASLAEAAKKIFDRLGYTNIHVVIGDGSRGYAEAAPYDAIIVAAAAPRVPDALVEQLKDGGRAIVPVGEADLQQLRLISKNDGAVQRQTLDACRFVPLVGEEGYAER